MVFTTEWFQEVAIEIWPEWDLNPQPLNSPSDALTDWAMSSTYTHSQLCVATPILFFIIL